MVKFIKKILSSDNTFTAYRNPLIKIKIKDKDSHNRFSKLLFHFKIFKIEENKKVV